ncbi:head-tail connector protein [Wenxinia saemankumensis]|uniref:head-tail connector protein n=1 Tax=Wenxinia saemankumensis TaxID=1447782 RepID=UPI00147F8E24|nr:head-tail connector protein [Wenxinia saemankumensis]
MTTPVSLDEAKAHLRIDGDDEDLLISSLIEAATGHLDGADGVLGRCLVTQTWTVRFDYWASVLRLPFPDVRSVEISFGGAEPAPASAYDLIEDSSSALIYLDADFARPAPVEGRGGITVTLVAGYGDAADVPAPIKAAILLTVGALFENREQTIVGASVAEHPLARALMAPFRRIAF